jgi:hypothetical protein
MKSTKTAENEFSRDPNSKFEDSGEDLPQVCQQELFEKRAETMKRLPSKRDMVTL